MFEPAYSLEELLSQCDQNVAPSDEESDWLESVPEGREIGKHDEGTNAI